MLSRKEINQRYYENHKDELRQKRKEASLEKKKQILMKKKEDLNFVEQNIYLKRMGGCEMNEYCEKRKMNFDLEYDINHLNNRKKGDKDNYFKEKKEAFQKYCIDMDVKFRIERYRLFRNSFLKSVGKEPNLTAMIVNDNFIPEEVNPKSEKYDENLLSLLEKKDEDIEIEIKQVSDILDDE